MITATMTCARRVNTGEKPTGGERTHADSAEHLEYLFNRSE